MKQMPVAIARLLPLGMLLCFSLLLSCHGPEEEKKQTPAATTATITNEYTNESVFESALRKAQANPDNAAALYHLADLYYRDGRYEEAQETFRKVVALDPENGYAYMKLGTSLSQLNRPQEAIEAHLKAAEHLANPMVYNNLAIAYGKAGMLDEEIKALKDALALRPKFAIARFNLGICYLAKNDREAAMGQYEELKKFDITMANNLLKRINSQH